MKIRFKLVTGDEYTISNEVCGGDKPLDEMKARVQLVCLMTKVAHFVCDQGEVISAQHIVSAHIEP